MSDKCRGWFGRIRCNFEPRYDGGDVDPNVIEALGVLIATLPNFTATGKSTYVCDVCTACGEQRTRSKP